MRYLGITYISGGMHTYISSRIRAISLNTSHFLGQASNKGKHSHNKKHWTEILIKRTSDRREQAYRLRRAIIESGIEYKWNTCNIQNTWQGKELKIQINHINGDPLNNRRENLEFLCPNCHSQTPTWGKSANKKPKQKKPKRNLEPNLCLDCKKVISYRALRCKSCSQKFPRTTKIDWPQDEKLLNMLKNNSFVSVGRQLGVSDNAIRKRLKRKT